jgi:hypothetical protein
MGRGRELGVGRCEVRGARWQLGRAAGAWTCVDVCRLPMRCGCRGWLGDARATASQPPTTPSPRDVKTAHRYRYLGPRRHRSHTGYNTRPILRPLQSLLPATASPPQLTTACVQRLGHHCLLRHSAACAPPPPSALLHPYINPSLHSLVCPSVCLYVCTSVRLSVCPSVRLSVCTPLRLPVSPVHPSVRSLRVHVRNGPSPERDTPPCSCHVTCQTRMGAQLLRAESRAS